MTGSESRQNPARRWRLRHAVATVFIVAALARLWALGSIPLIITNDSTGYLANAQQLASGQELKIAAVRTPGYPLFLAVLHEAFGTSPTAILMGHHFLGVLTCLLITVTAARLSPWRRAGPALGTAAGLLAALDPWILGMESFALTETISAFVLTLAFAMATLIPRPRWLWGVLLGAVLGYACIVRPTFQVIVPFMGLGWIWTAVWRAKRPVMYGAALGACLVVGLAAPIAPWLRFNHARGIDGLARGGDTMFIAGIGRAGLLREDYPKLTEQQREAYAELKPAPWAEDRVFAFLAKADGWHNAESRRALMEWAKYSIRQDLPRYFEVMGHALLWQLNRFPASASVKYNETAGYIQRLGEDGTRPPYKFPHPNFQFNDQSHDMTPYAMRAPLGPLAEFDRWMYRTYWKHRWTQGLPQIPLFAAAVWTGLVCLPRRRTWGLALVIAGTGAFFAVHVVMVLPFSRYGLPAWAVWYILLPLAIPMTTELWRRERGTTGPAEAETPPQAAA